MSISLPKPQEGPPDLDPAVRKKVRAVVVDSNVYGHAKPDLANLAHMALRLNGIHVETWVPELVAWEWAQHLADDWNVIATAASAERKNLSRAGVPLPAPSLVYETPAGLVRAFLEKISQTPYLRIIPATPENALAGLRDQVLQLAPGRRKSNVKTGASDSAWLRDVLDAAEESAQLLFLTSDRDIKTAFATWKLAPPVMCTRAELGATLFGVTLDDGRAAWAIFQYVDDLFLYEEKADELAAFDIGNAPELSAAIARTINSAETQVYESSIIRLKSLAGIDSVSIESAPRQGPAVTSHGQLGPQPLCRAVADVFVIADARASVGQSVPAPAPEPVDVCNILVRARLAFDFADLTITAASVEDDAEVLVFGADFASSADAVGEIRQALLKVPLLTMPPDFGPNSESGPRHVLYSAGDVYLEAVWKKSRVWTLEFTFENEWLTDGARISCEYRQSNLLSGQGEQGSILPYRVVVEDGYIPRENPIWGLSAWIISVIDWDAVQI